MRLHQASTHKIQLPSTYQDPPSFTYNYQLRCYRRRDLKEAAAGARCRKFLESGDNAQLPLRSRKVTFSLMSLVRALVSTPSIPGTPWHIILLRILEVGKFILLFILKLWFWPVWLNSGFHWDLVGWVETQRELEVGPIWSGSRLQANLCHVSGHRTLTNFHKK